MRIAFDVSDLAPFRGKSRGIYSYARHLIDAMVLVLPKGVQISVLCNGDSFQHFSHLQSNAVRVRLVYKGYPGVLQRVAWCAVGGAWATRRERADLYFSPKGFAPLALRALGGVGRVSVTIHDLIPLWYARHFPGAVGPLERIFINGWLIHSAKTADCVIAVSRATADAIDAETGRTEGIHVVLNGVPELPVPTYRGPRDCIFALTSPLAHKNAEGVFAAYAHYRRGTADPLPLIVCGIPGSSSHGDSKGVTTVTEVLPLELANLYARARAFLFLPFIEGFGFPVCEAIRFGTPVVCSDIAALRESSGGQAVFVEPGDAPGCARALQTVISESLSTVTPQTGAASSDTWATCAHATLSALLEPSSLPRRPPSCGATSPP